MAFKETFKKNKFVALFVYWALACKGVITYRVIKRSLKTGERRKTVDDMSSYVDFCLSEFRALGFDKEATNSALEIGPGDSTALAEEIAQLKNCTIDLIDKFQRAGRENDEQLLKGPNYVRWLNAKGGVSTTERFADEQYDLIYSVSVIEHLWPWQKALGEYISALKPRGVMYHIVNFTDHGLFTPFHDPFLFRRVPRLLYDPAMRPIGRPNRALPSELHDFFEGLGFHVDVKIIRTHTRVLDYGEVYCRRSIPEAEVAALAGSPPKYLDPDEFILDQCIGSALFRVSWRG